MKPCCCHAAMSIRLRPKLRRVGEGYSLWGEGGDESQMCAEVGASPAGPERVRLSLSLRKGARMTCTEVHPVDED